MKRYNSKKEAEKYFNQLYKEAKKDPNIIGFFLGGSRGKGFITKYSDYDIYIIVKDKVAKSYKRRYELHNKYFDICVSSYTEFKKYAALGSPSEGDRYNYAHIRALVDKNGKIQKLINEKARIPKKKLNKYIEGHLDGYINFVYRSFKCLRDGQFLGARLEAAYSIPLFFNVIFALHNGRLRPYYKYLKWELNNYPLEKFPLSSKEILECVSKILDNADIKSQQKLLKATEKLCRKEGYGYVFDSWGENINWMKKFKNF